MSDSIISSFTELTSIATDDEFVIVDKSDTSVAVSGTTKKVKTSSIIDTDGTLAGNLDSKVASQKATKTYADTKAPTNNPSFTGTVSVAGAITQSGTADHITLTPGTNKLVKIAVLRQDDTTNTYVPSSVVLTGRKPITISAGQANATTIVSFGITFLSAPIVILVSSTNLSVFATFAEVAVAGVNGTPSTSSFSLIMLTRSGTVSANRACQADWIAIGTL